jgi:adenylyltransferase/sulfurtransferase
VESHVARLDATNVEELIEPVDLILDGSDNLETRYVINDACVERCRPWIYGGVVGTAGMTLTVTPGRGPCLRCVFPTAPPPGILPTCESHGVLGTVPALIAALQATEAIKLLAGAQASTDLLSVDLWERTFQQIQIGKNPTCPACGDGRAGG